MHPVKQWLVGIGAVVAFFGWECMPHGQSLHPENFLSLFAKSSDAGTFLSFGAILLIIGIGIFILGALLPMKWN
jgi:hypothetical protein